MYYLTTRPAAVIHGGHKIESNPDDEVAEQFKYVAFAKTEPFIHTDIAEVVNEEPGQLWFDFGSNPTEAFTNLLGSLMKLQVLCQCPQPLNWYPTDKPIIDHCYRCGKPLLDNMAKAELS